MLGQALAADAGSPVQPVGPIVNAACANLPSSATLDARIVSAAGTRAQPAAAHRAATSASSGPSPSGSGPSSSSSDSVSASDTTSPSPSDSSSTSPSASPSTDPTPSSGTTSPSSTPTPTPSPTSATPTPTPTHSSPAPKPKTPQLCVQVQSLSAGSQVQPGSFANFVVWVWSNKAQSNGVTVRVHVASATGVHSPSFAVCPQLGSATCRLGNVPTGTTDELQVAVQVGTTAAVNEQVELTADASAANAKPVASMAADVVTTAQSTSPGGTGTGTGQLPPVSLPPIPGVGDAAPGDASGLFPTVGPAPSPSSSSLGLPQVKPHKTVRVAEAAATVPLDSRLIGGQLAGLAVLAGAVVIAITRLSLRTPKPAEDKGGEAKPPAG
jgi:hypothetical protein